MRTQLGGWNIHTSWPPQEKLFIWPAPFSQYNKHLLRQKTVGTFLYISPDGHWLAMFEVIPPPPRPQKLVFGRGQTGYAN